MKVKTKHHWAYEIAMEIRKSKPLGNGAYKLQSSISPSGYIHIGNFRDTVTVWAVRRVLAIWGIDAEFILNFDDADCAKSRVFSEDERSKPLSEARIDNESASRLYSGIFLRELTEMGVIPDKIYYQSEMYFNSGRYEMLYKRVLYRKTALIKALNRCRTQKLSEKWFPFMIFCEGCKRTVSDLNIEPVHFYSRTSKRISYRCEACGCSYDGSLEDIKYKKLLWRIDWPMRCCYEKIDFEPCGIDHYTEGSTITTSREIFRKVFKSGMPLVAPYGIVRLFSSNRKISSSKGDHFNLTALGKLFSREIILWRYLSKALMSTMVINPQQDFFRYHLEFDRFIRNKAFHASEGKVFEILSIIDLSDKRPASNINIKLLTFVSQAYHYDDTLILGHLKNYYKDIEEESLVSELREKLPRIRYWLENYAPAKCRFGLKKPDNIEKKHKELAGKILEYMGNQNVSFLGDEYKTAYEVLLGKPFGPKLHTILNHWNREEISAHCRAIC